MSDRWLFSDTSEIGETMPRYRRRVRARRVGARRTVLTHMGQDMDWAWLVAHLPPGVEPGYDGMVLEMPD